MVVGWVFFIKRYTCFDLVESWTYIDDNGECILIKFVYQNNKNFRDNVYRSLHGNYGIFLDTLSPIFETCVMNFSDDKIFLVGDFNLNLLKYDTNRSVQRFAHKI